jgi:putative endonuclease
MMPEGEKENQEQRGIMTRPPLAYGSLDSREMANNAREPFSRRALGRRGEDLAAQVLLARGYDIVERNWRCRAGEVDLIAEHQGVRVFVEVRTRRGRAFGTPEESITPKKRARMIEVAITYLSEHGLDNVDWRIDVVAIEVGRNGQARRVTVIPNAVQMW